jgi:putative ABC transport system permease protein
VNRYGRLDAAIDLVVESWRSIRIRSGRTLLTGLGTVVGVSVFISTVGLANSAAASVSSGFDALRNTSIQLRSSQQSGPHAKDAVFPTDTAERAEQVAGVTHAGRLQVVSTQATLTTHPPRAAGGGAQLVDVYAADTGALQAAGGTALEGRFLSEWETRRPVPVAIIGADLAADIGLHDLAVSPAIFLNGNPLVVQGVLGAAPLEPALRNAVLVSFPVARALWSGSGEAAQVLVRVQPGAAHQAGEQLPLAVRPDRPETIEAISPPDPRHLRDQVDKDLRSLLVTLSVASLLIGALGIATATSSSVLQRSAEIGLRRALGATRRQVGAQILTETMLTSAAATVIGIGLGIAVIAGVAWAQGWVPVLDPRSVLTGALAGLAAGVFAGMIPGLRAARIEPRAALSS